MGIWLLLRIHSSIRCKTARYSLDWTLPGTPREAFSKGLCLSRRGLFSHSWPEETQYLYYLPVLFQNIPTPSYEVLWPSCWCLSRAFWGSHPFPSMGFHRIPGRAVPFHEILWPSIPLFLLPYPSIPFPRLPRSFPQILSPPSSYTGLLRTMCDSVTMVNWGSVHCGSRYTPPGMVGLCYLPSILDTLNSCCHHHLYHHSTSTPHLHSRHHSSFTTPHPFCVILVNTIGMSTNHVLNGPPCIPTPIRLVSLLRGGDSHIMLS